LSQWLLRKYECAFASFTASVQVGASISGKPGMEDDRKSLKQLNFQVTYVACFCQGCRLSIHECNAEKAAIACICLHKWLHSGTQNASAKWLVAVTADRRLPGRGNLLSLLSVSVDSTAKVPGQHLWLLPQLQVKQRNFVC